MSVTIPRAVRPATNPAGLLATAGAVLAAVVMIVNAVNNHGIIDTTVIVAAVGAVGALLTRQTVTPLADPKAADGTQLTPVTPVAPGTASTTTTTSVTPPPAL